MILNGSSRLVAVAVAVLVLVGAGCTSQADGDVATLKSDVPEGATSGAYVNEATAGYAECLEGLGLTVAPVAVDAEGREGMEGYAEIDGAASLVGDDGLVVSPDAPIGVDGEDRDADIRGCYAEHPGSKDAIIDMADYDPPPEEAIAPAGSEQFEQGIHWAECARDAGVSEVADPPSSGVDEGYVIIPASVTLDQVEMLGEECSRPMAIDMVDGETDTFPLFSFQVTGDLDPYLSAVESPLIEIGKCQSISGDECIEKLGW